MNFQLACLFLFATAVIVSGQSKGPRAHVRLTTNVNKVKHGNNFNLTCEYELVDKSDDWKLIVSFHRQIMADKYDAAEFKRTYTVNSFTKQIKLLIFFTEEGDKMVFHNGTTASTRDNNKYMPAGGRTEQPKGSPLTVTVIPDKMYGGYYCEVTLQKGANEKVNFESETIYEKSH